MFSNIGIETMYTSSDSGADVHLGLLKKLTALFSLKSWTKVSINFTLAAMHLAYLMNTDFNKV